MSDMSRRTCLAGMAGAVASCGVDAQVTQRDRRVRPNLYQCEGCEGVYEANLAALSSHARIGPAGEPGTQLRAIGTVFHSDGRTPAAGVVIYAYQTNAKGLYANGTNVSEWSRRHGRLRGWVKTGADGAYAFDTIKPAPYPDQTLPAHIHFTVLEPGKRPYWIDDIVFDGEFGVTPEYRRKMVNQGGDGIVRLTHGADGIAVAHRKIVLERHPGTAGQSR
jgi:protocatechuate 3,4-dioxygenase, beta subunit